MSPARQTAKEITFEELVARFDPSVHDDVREAARLPGTSHIVLHENLQMDSSMFGDISGLSVGPGRSMTLDYVLDTPGWRIGDVPSRFKYPVAFARVPS